jgi:hypothetical protein
MLQGLESSAKEKAIKESNIFMFCMSLAASAGELQKGTDAKPVCTAPGFDDWHVKDLQKLFASESTSVNTMKYEDKEDEKGCVNMVTARAEMTGGGHQTARYWTWKRRRMARPIMLISL